MLGIFEIYSPIVFLFGLFLEKFKVQNQREGKVQSFPIHTLLHVCIASPVISYHQFSSVTQACLTLHDPMDCSIPGFPDHHQLPELSQTHVHRVGDAIQPSHLLSSPSLPAFSLFQHQGLFQWVSSSHQVAKVLALQLQHQSFQWIFRTDFL